MGINIVFAPFFLFNINSETTIGFRKHPHFQYKKYIPDYTGMVSANWQAVGSALTIGRKQFPTPQQKIRVVQINGGAKVVRSPPS